MLLLLLLLNDLVVAVAGFVVVVVVVVHHRYETSVFMRHVAVAAALPGEASGGWMSGFDVLPLRYGCQPLPNKGK